MNIWELNEDMPDGPDPWFEGLPVSATWEDDLLDEGCI